MSLRNRASTSPSIPLASALAALTAFVALAAGPPEAAACECGFSQIAEPSFNSRKVPTNTKVWITLMSCSAPTLQKIDDGTFVPGIATMMDDVQVFHPSEPLELGSTYVVFSCDGTSVTTFTVNEGPDNDPPPRPTVSTLNPESSPGDFSSCGGYEYVPLLAEQTDMILTLDIAGRAALDPKEVSGAVLDVFFPAEQLLVGNAICSSSNWTFDDQGAAVDTRLGAFDYAGNFSGWSDPETVDAGCGCEAAGAEPTPRHAYGIGALGLLAAFALRRRCSRSTK
jgi:MYXO-CTERM domain-containing protein